MLTLLLICGAFIGCSNNASEEENNSSDVNEPQENEPKEEFDVTDKFTSTNGVIMTTGGYAANPIKILR